MIKKEANRIDCVKMKRSAQEQLWNELKPTSVQDYLAKLQNHIEASSWWNEAKKNAKIIL